MPDDVRERIAQWRARQMEEHLPCPRCGLDKMSETPLHNALSRHADVYVCDDCGTDEAIRDYTGRVLPLEEWVCMQP